MELYTALRHFADSWGLLAMTIFFLGVIVFALRPGTRQLNDSIAQIPFRHEDRPAQDDCTGCGDCDGTCNRLPTRLEA